MKKIHYKLQIDERTHSLKYKLPNCHDINVIYSKSKATIRPSINDGVCVFRLVSRWQQPTWSTAREEIKNVSGFALWWVRTNLVVCAGVFHMLPSQFSSSGTKEPALKSVPQSRWPLSSASGGTWKSYLQMQKKRTTALELEVTVRASEPDFQQNTDTENWPVSWTLKVCV